LSDVCLEIVINPSEGDKRMQKDDIKGKAKKFMNAACICVDSIVNHKLKYRMHKFYSLHICAKWVSEIIIIE